MTQTTTTITFRDILESVDLRFSPKYFLVSQKIGKIETSPKITIKTLGEVTDYIISGSYIPKYSLSGTPYLRVANIKSFELNLNNDDIVFINEQEVEIPNKIKTAKHDILIGRTAVLGFASLSNDLSNRSIISQHLTRLKAKEIPAGYLVAFLNSSLFKKQMDVASYGITRTELTHQQLKSVKVIIPEEKVLNEINNLVIKADQSHVLAISKIKDAKHLLEEALNINHQKINEDKVYSVNSSDLTDVLTPKFYYPKYLNTLKALKKKFKTIKLGEIADIKRGDEVGSKNYRKYVDRKDSDVPFIRTSDLVNYEIDNYPDYYLDEEIYKELKQDLEAGDIIYTKDGKIGLPAILTKEDKCILASGLARIRIKKELNPYYVFLVLSTNISLYQAMQRVVIAATLPHLQQERLGEIEIPIINGQTQDQISQLVAEAFKLKTEKKKLFREALTKVEELLK